MYYTPNALATHGNKAFHSALARPGIVARGKMHGLKLLGFKKPCYMKLGQNIPRDGARTRCGML